MYVIFEISIVLYIKKFNDIHLYNQNLTTSIYIVKILSVWRACHYHHIYFSMARNNYFYQLLKIILSHVQHVQFIIMLI